VTLYCSFLLVLSAVSVTLYCSFLLVLSAVSVTYCSFLLVLSAVSVTYCSFLLVLSAVTVTLYCGFLFSVLRPVQINWWRTTWSWGRRRSHSSHRHNNIIQLMKLLFAVKDKRLVSLCWNSYKFSTLQTPRFLLLSFLFLLLLNPIARSVWHGNIFCYIYRTLFFCVDIFVHPFQAFMYESQLWSLWWKNCRLFPYKKRR